MIWLTWRQLRASAAMMAGGLALFAAVLLLTGPALADDYASGIAACTQGGDCDGFLDRFLDENQTGFLGATAVALALPALVGLFWGAPLITRELEAGTHRLVWNQSITRTRWLAVKLGLTGLAAMAVAGLGSLVVSWWSSPIDKSAADQLPRIEPLLFAARGIVPVGYAAFAFALGVTVGLLVRRTLPAMAITLAVFVAAQIAMAVLVRPHLLLPAVRETVVLTDVDGFNIDQPSGSGESTVAHVQATGTVSGAWVLSSHTVDASGGAVDVITFATSGRCDPPPPPDDPAEAIDSCLAEIERLGYRQEVAYHPASRFWPFQWIETGIYTAAALTLCGFCFWSIRRRLY